MTQKELALIIIFVISEMVGYFTLSIDMNKTATETQRISTSLMSSTLNPSNTSSLMQSDLESKKTPSLFLSSTKPIMDFFDQTLITPSPIFYEVDLFKNEDLLMYEQITDSPKLMLSGLIARLSPQEQGIAIPITDFLLETKDVSMENGNMVESTTQAMLKRLNDNGVEVKDKNYESNTTMISPTIVWRHSQGKLDIVYGHAMFVTPVYKYLYPLILGTCLLTTSMLAFTLSKKLRKLSSQMNKASCMLLFAIAAADSFTMCFALAEVIYRYVETDGNNGILLFGKCRVMLVLERLSAIPHA